MITKLVVFIISIILSLSLKGQNYHIPFYNGDYMGIKNSKGIILIEPEFEDIEYKGGNLLELIYTDPLIPNRNRTVPKRENKSILNNQYMINGTFVNCHIKQTCGIKSIGEGFLICDHRHDDSEIYQELMDSNGDSIFVFENVIFVKYIYSNSKYLFIIVNHSKTSPSQWILYKIQKKNHSVSAMNKEPFYSYQVREHKKHSLIDFSIEVRYKNSFNRYLYDNKLDSLVTSEIEPYSQISDQLFPPQSDPTFVENSNKLKSKYRETYDSNLIKFLKKNDSISYHLNSITIVEEQLFTLPKFTDNQIFQPFLLTAFKKNKIGLYNRNFNKILPQQYDEILINDYDIKNLGEIILSNFYITRKGSKYGIFTLKTDEEFLKYEIDYLLEPVFDHIPLFYYDDYYNIKDLKIFGLYDRETSKLVGFANDKGKMY